MFASLSAENRIRERLQSLGVTSQFLSALSGVHNYKISEGLRNLREFSPHEASVLLELTARLIDLVDAFQPLPLALNNPSKVRALLDHLDEKGLTADDIRKVVATFFQ